MNPVSNAISSLSATPYVDAFTTGEVIGFVVLIICTQIVITLLGVIWIRKCTYDYYEALAQGLDTELGHIKATVDDISDRLPERM